jgi:hypothetical protein
MNAPSKEEARKVSIGGPLEGVDGKMLLQIPLDAGGRDLAPFAKGIGQIVGDFLVVEVLPWLAEKLHVHVGSEVIVDNLEGKFRITRNDKEPIQPPQTTTGSSAPDRV